jgi:hypothetical protein
MKYSPMKSHLIIILLFCSTVLVGQQNQSKQLHYWKKLFLVSKSFGINSEGVKIHTYTNRNRKKPADEWIFPWALGFEQSEINNKKFIESGYKSYNSIYVSVGRNGFKHFKNNFYFNGMLNVGLGNEKLMDYSEKTKNQFLIGLEASQGLLFIPRSDFGFVFGVSVFEKIFTSKIYSFDVRVQFSAGITF